MNTLRARLTELGFEEPDAPPVGRPVDQKLKSQAQPFKRTDPLLELPFLGEVSRVEDDRGFGWIRVDGGDIDGFFHIKGRVGPKKPKPNLPSPGTQILFAVGSDPRDPHRRRAVRWMPVNELGLGGTKYRDQSDLDVARREAMGALKWAALAAVLRADWYRRYWNGRAPADLTDAILETVSIEALGSVPASQIAAFWREFQYAPYTFSSKYSGDGIARIPDLQSFSVEQLAALGKPKASWMDGANSDFQSRLREWHIVSKGAIDEASEWRPFFTGSDSREAIAAASLIASGPSLIDDAREWISSLAANALLDPSSVQQWISLRPDEALSLFDRLPYEAQLQQLTRWRTSPETLKSLDPDSAQIAAVLSQTSLVVDLETDGERIWEIGCVRGGKPELVYGREEKGTLADALSKIASHIKAVPLMVGHNIERWDWPILERAADIREAPTIWDTLLVEFLLRPQAASHALGGSHRADADAAAGLALFQSQIMRLPAQAAAQVLLNDLGGRSLTALLAEKLEGDLNYARNPPPSAASDLIQILPADKVRDYDWVPGVRVVAVDATAGLPLDLYEVDVDRFAAAIANDLSEDLGAQTLLAVLRNSKRQDIAVRRNMIPVWLLDGNDRLVEAVDGACIMPQDDGGIRIAPAPLRIDWWLSADRSTVAFDELSDVVLLPGQSLSVPERSAPPDGDWSSSSLTKVAAHGEAVEWCVSDRADNVLSANGGKRKFVTLAVQHREERPADNEEGWENSVLFLQRDNVLFPHSHDQATYWQEVLGAVAGLVSERERNVPILLVGSSESAAFVKMLETALAEIGLGEIRPSHRSRREHLRRAAASGHVIVDSLANWRNWKSIGDSLGVNVQAIVEALPTEQWYACEAAVSASEPSTENVGTAPSLHQKVRLADILENIPSLLPKHLPDWLDEKGLGTPASPALVLDARLGRNMQVGSVKIPSRNALGASLSEADRARLDVVLAPFRLKREDAPSDLASMEEFFVRHWSNHMSKPGPAITGFKESQRAAMEEICGRTKHVLVPLPTGEGKSVLFQVPALCRGLRNRRLTLVVSPLKALMRDQVEGLVERGFSLSVDYLSSDLTPGERAEVMQGILDHRIVLLYVSPERMRSPSFLAALDKRMQSDEGLEYVVFDEAHCVNQWGYEFRPDYFFAADALLARCRVFDAGNATPFLMLSATITAADRRSLQSLMDGPEERPILPFVVRPESFTNPIRSHIKIEPSRVGGVSALHDEEAAITARLPIIEGAIASAAENFKKTGQRSAGIVFVQSRRLAEILADKIAEATGARVATYHAGLDSAEREEAYSEFREQRIDVLVATKAFGMGMDISDIHWIVHFSPSSTLEDYLQEVGRIGRGKKERERAELTTLSAALPFSDHDFETIRDRRAINALTPEVADDLLRKIRDQVVADKSGSLMTVIPACGYDAFKNDGERRANETKTRMSLYWLERAGYLTLHATLPDALTVELHASVLESIVGEVGPMGELAALLRQVNEPEANEQDVRGSDAGLLGRALDFVADKLGVVFGRRSEKPSASLFDRRSKIVETFPTLLNVSKVRIASPAFKTNDDVLAALADLEKRGALSIERSLKVSRRALADAPSEKIDALFQSVELAVSAVMRKLSSHGVARFDPLELIDLTQLLASSEAPTTDDRGRGEQARDAERAGVARIDTLLKAYEGGLKSLLRVCGVKLIQESAEDDSLIWEASLPPTRIREAKRQRGVFLTCAKSLFETLRSVETEAPLSLLIDLMQQASASGRFSEQDLRRTAGLLSALRLVGISVSVLESSHIVEVENSENEERALAVWKELADVNEFAEARNLAMELFANLRVEAHEDFIAGYFAQSTGPALRAFLDTQLGEIEQSEDGQGSTVIALMQEQLRSTKVVELFEKFRNSEEPAQWEAIQQPHNQHLLVNAGPGAGKTFVLVGRIVHLIREQRIRPSQIVVLAFNRAVVFEIRRRIRELFRSLGYAAYASRLRVSTVHGFALKNLREHGGPANDVELDKVLQEFAARMETDPIFRAKVAGDFRCILVDEFQDVTEHIYSVVRNLHRGSGSRAGVMVIGDDDQDILRYQRKNGVFSETYFDRFSEDFAQPELKQLSLRVNFRSSDDIVKRSQASISKFFEKNSLSRRLKTFSLAARQSPPENGRFERFNWKGRSFEDAVQEIPKISQESKLADHETLAILCRSNAEVASASRILEPYFPELAIQGTADVRLAALRHQALWLDFLRDRLKERDSILTQELKTQFIDEFYSVTDIPEMASSSDALDSLGSVWDLCGQERDFPRLSTLVRFSEDMRCEDLARLAGSERSAPVLVSTIHKVKGLEFDNVIVLPSSMRFPLSEKRPDDLSGGAAEEARLLYVAMTRAKRRLFYFVGDRELCWSRAKPSAFAASTEIGRLLTGSHKEVFLSWAIQPSNFNPDPAACQEYIEKEVRVGDPIIVCTHGQGRGKALLHRSASGVERQVGFIAKKFGSGGPKSQLRVSSVIRHVETTGIDSRPSAHPPMVGYAVLVSGRLN